MVPPVQLDPKHVPLIPRLWAAGRSGVRGATSAWQQYPGPELTAEMESGHPLAPAGTGLGTRPAAAWRRLTSRAFTRRVIVALVICVVLIASCGALNISRGTDALAAARDAKAQIAAIQAALRAGATDVSHLQQVQTQLDGLDRDLQRLQADIPFAPVVTRTPGLSGVTHLLRLATDLVHAGQAAMPAAIILAPHVKELTTSLQAASGLSAPATATADAQTPAPPPLTTESVQQAGAALDHAIPLLQAAVAERAYVSDTELRLIGLGKYVPMLHTLDAYAAYFPAIFQALHAVANTLPTLLGISQPTNFILFAQDSDQLRPTGGALAAYALLTVADGKIASGLQLRDIGAVECPLGQTSCSTPKVPAAPVSSPEGTAPLDVRDSNVNPDFPTSARLAEQLLQRQAGGAGVQGVFAITSRVLEQILQATGPVTIVPYCEVVTADNLRDVLHYLQLGSAHGLTTMCPAGSSPSAPPASFQTALSTTLVHHIAILQRTQQTALLKALLGDFQSHDIQLYFNDPSLQSVVAAFGVDGSVQSPPGDSLFVVDNNTSASYANEDVTETVSDSITLDAHGTATHDLRVTYSYPKVAHVFSDLYALDHSSSSLQDVVRIIVPEGAHLLAQDGCAPYATTQAGHAVWACSFVLAPTQNLTLHVRWAVPHAAVTSNGSVQYGLLIQKQAGSLTSLRVTIAAPPAASLAQPLQPELRLTATGRALYSGTLAHDLRLSIGYGS